MAIPTKIAERNDYLRNIAANRGILYFTDVGYVRLAKCDGSDNGRAGYAVNYDLVQNWKYRVRRLDTAYEQWLYGAYHLYTTSGTRSEWKGYLWPTPISEDAFRWAKPDAYYIGRCQFFLVSCTEQELLDAGLSSKFRNLCMGQKVYSNVSIGGEVEYRVLRRTPDAHMIVVRDTIRNEELMMSAAWDFRLEPTKKPSPGSVITTTDLASGSPYKSVDARPIGVALPPDASAWVNSQGTPGSCYGASHGHVMGRAGEDIEEGELVKIQDVNKDTGLPTIVAVREDKPKDAWVPKVGDWVKLTKPKDSNDAFSGWVKKMDHLDGKVVLLQADASKYGGRKLCVVDLKATGPFESFQWNIRPEWCQKAEATQKDRDSTLFLYDGKPYRLATKDDVGKQAIVGFLVSEAVNNARHKAARIRKLLSVPDIQYRNNGERSGLGPFESEDNGRWLYAWVDATEKTWKPKVGDWVKVTKPKDENERPGWLPYMDRFDGKVMRVREVPTTRHFWYRLSPAEAPLGSSIGYALEWLSPAEAPKEPELPEGTATAAFIERLDRDPIELAGPIKVSLKCVVDENGDGKAWFDLVGKKQVAIVPLDSLKASLAEKEPAQIPGIPEGFRPVEVRKVKKGEWYLDVATPSPKAYQYGKAPNSPEESMFVYLILEPINKKG